MTDKHRYAYWILSVLLALLLIFSAFMYSKTKTLETAVENNYNRAFHELVTYVDDMDTLLQKSMLVSSASQMSTISSELFRQSSSAKACLGQLPVSQVQLENTEKFLSQIGDYTYYLSQNVINSKDITDEDYKNLTALSSYASNLNADLTKMQTDLYAGNISFTSSSNNGGRYLSNIVSAAADNYLNNFENVEKEFHEYPSLIYDGPFSEHIENIKPMLLENKKTIASDEGLKIAKEFLGDIGQNLSFSGETQNSSIDSYTYSSSSDGREIYIAISKKGGCPVYFLDNRNVEAEKISFKDAISKAHAFLSSKGYNSMKESYYDKSDGVATVNFAYTQSNVVCYSDLIKVKIALDTGDIVGFEANGYIMNHRQREFGERKLTQEEAKNLINSHLSVTSTSVALIPKDSKKEILCYEFKGSHNGRNFLIYINVNSGNEEEILMLIESEDGILTV